MTSVRASTPRDAARALFEHHHAIIQLPKDLLIIADDILAEGRRFFDSDEETRRAAACPEILEGYRALGSEKDAVTGRPDLSESFTTWFRNASHPKVQAWARHCPFHGIMSEGLGHYAGFTDQVLSAIRAEIDPRHHAGDAADVDIRSLSYLQMNFYRPATHSSRDRDTMMDPHEDGHILTILKPTRPGLMIGPGELVEAPSARNPVGVFRHDRTLQPVEVAADEAILVPSSPTFYLTGGLIKPLFHGVANRGDAIRQSLMFFVNPTRSISLEPWLRTDTNRGVDIHQVVDAVSAQYGQPAISQSVEQV